MKLSTLLKHAYLHVYGRVVTYSNTSKGAVAMSVPTTLHSNTQMVFNDQDCTVIAEKQVGRRAVAQVRLKAADGMSVTFGVLMDADPALLAETVKTTLSAKAKAFAMSQVFTSWPSTAEDDFDAVMDSSNYVAACGTRFAYTTLQEDEVQKVLKQLAEAAQELIDG